MECAVSATPLSVTQASLLDPMSRGWLDALGTEGPAREAALSELHALLLRAARHEARRRRPSLPEAVVADLEDLTLQAADDALLAITAKLGQFRGDSRFTTWAYMFVVVEVSAKLRRRAWRGQDLNLDAEEWERVPDSRAGPGHRAESLELLATLKTAVASELTERQREVFVSVALNEVPLDVLAERMQTTRGAIYKVLHDARKKLRAHLAERGMGFSQEEDA